MTNISFNTFNSIKEAFIASERNQYYGARGNLDSLIRQHFQSRQLDTKEETRLFNCCEFVTDVNDADLTPDGKIRRCVVNLISISALVIDVDDKYGFDEYRDMLLSKFSSKFFGYTTFNNSEEREKFRFVVPFSHSIPKEIATLLKPAWAEMFDCDLASFSLSQAFYLPSHSKANAHLVRFEQCNWNQPALNWEDQWDIPEIVQEIIENEGCDFSKVNPEIFWYSQEEVQRVLSTCSNVRYTNGMTLAAICRSAGMGFEQYSHIVNTVAGHNSSIRDRASKQSLFDATENFKIRKVTFQSFVESHGGVFDAKSQYDLMSYAERAQLLAKMNEKKVEAPLVEEDKIITIPTGAKLSSIADQLDLSAKNTLLVSPTGSGKSHYVAKVATGKRIMVVPNVTNIENMVQACDNLKVAIKPFYSGHNDVSTNDELIITTYDSLARLVHQLKDCNERTVFMDETHVFISNSSKDYKHSAHTQALAVLDKFAKIVQLTATPLFHNIEQLKTDNIIMVENEKKPTRIYQNLVSDCVIDAVVNMVEEKNKIGEQSIVYLNNTQEDKSFGKLTESLKLIGLKVACVNSKTRGTDDYTDVIVDGDMSKVDVVVATVVLKEGVSIEKHSKVVNIFTIGAWHPVEIEQMANRPRNAEAINLFIAKSAEETTFDGTFDKVRVRERVFASAEMSAADLHKAYGRTFLTSSEQQVAMTLAMHGEVLKFDGRKVVVDQMLLANKLFNMEKNMAFVDNKFMEEELAKFGWVKHTTLTNNNELDEHIKTSVTEKVKLSAEQKKVEKELKTKLISFDHVSENLEALAEVDEGRSVMDGLELTIRRQFDLVASVLNIAPHEKMTKAAQALEIIGTSNAEIARFKKSVMIDRIKNGNGEESIKSFINGIYEFVEGETRVTAKDINMVVNECFKKYCEDNNLPVRTLSQRKTSELFGLMVDGKKINTTVDGGSKIQVFLIDSLDPLANVRSMIEGGRGVGGCAVDVASLIS